MVHAGGLSTPRRAGTIEAWCFGESASRVALSVDPAAVPAVLERATNAGVRAVAIGSAGGTRLVVDGAFDVALTEATTTWRDAIPNLVAADVHV